MTLKLSSAEIRCSTVIIDEWLVQGMWSHG